jgi:hypothetical protein
LNNRCDFIEIFYLFLQLKLIDMFQPDTFSFTCKDAIDVGGTASAEFYAFVEILLGDASAKTVEHINNLLYIPPLLLRERIVIADRFDRMVKAIKRIETTREEMGGKEFRKTIGEVFGKFYQSPILKMVTVVPHL